ncbi:MAG: energy transducer TonB [Blastocatellia bacterium]
MKTSIIRLVAFFGLLALVSLTEAEGRQSATRPSTKPATAQPQGTAPAPQAEKPPPSVSELITQGKSLYRAKKYKPALAKFEEALKQEPENDEALGLAAVTAYRLDNQAQSRGYFLRRAELRGQKGSVKAYSYYRAALSHWRQVHDIVAKFCEPKDGRYFAGVPDRHELDVKYGIDNGLDYAERALSITKNFAEAYNIRNLLHSEAALAATTEEKAAEHRKKAVEALRRAIELAKPAAFGTTNETADFSAPTIRVAEFAARKEEEGKTEDSMMKLLAGGQPLKRVQPGFPSVRAPKDSDPASTGVTADGGAYSLGGGRGALTAAYAPGKVKVEVLIAANGSVVYTHVVDGRSDLRGVAIMAARSWKFAPAKFEGKPVQVSGVIAFNLRPK